MLLEVGFSCSHILYASFDWRRHEELISTYRFEDCSMRSGPEGPGPAYGVVAFDVVVVVSPGEGLQGLNISKLPGPS